MSLSRYFTKCDFLYYNENTQLINTITHEGLDRSTIISDDPTLTNELNMLKDAVIRFESETGITISIE